jgi:hypothetical protein
VSALKHVAGERFRAYLKGDRIRSRRKIELLPLRGGAGSP